MLADSLRREGVIAARAGNLAAADSLLETALRLAPGSPPVHRALAGLRFLEQDWERAADHAETAIALGGADSSIVSLLGACRYLRGDPARALESWNRIGCPRVDSLSLASVPEARRPLLKGLLGVPPRGILEAGAYRRGLRRLGSLPSADAAALRLHPREDGSVSIEAVLSEAPALPRDPWSWGSIAARAGLDRFARVSAGGLLGRGERIAIAGRWGSARQAAAVSLALPANAALTVLSKVEHERESYTGASLAAPVEERTSLRLLAGGWRSGSLWLAGGATAEAARAAGEPGEPSEHAGDGAHPGTGRPALRVGPAAAAGWLDPSEHLAVLLSASAPRGVANAAGYGAASLALAWRAAASEERSAVSLNARGALRAVSRGAPALELAGAGSGSIRPFLLRSHDVTRGGRIDREALGSRFASAGIDLLGPGFWFGPAGLRFVLFTEGASWKTATGSSRSAACGGVEARIALAGGGGSLSIARAFGWTDRSASWSLSWSPPWPALPGSGGAGASGATGIDGLAAEAFGRGVSR